MSPRWLVLSASGGLLVILVNVSRAAPGRTEQPSDHRELSLGWTEFIPDLNQPLQDLLTKTTSPKSSCGVLSMCHSSVI